MKPHDLLNLDQSDALTLRSRLSLHCANLRGMVHTAEGAVIAPPQLSTDRNELADIRTLEAHASELELKLNGTAPAFNPPAVAKVAPVAAKAMTMTAQILASARRQTLDEEAAATLAAAGCKTGVELGHKLRQDQEAAKLAALPANFRQ